jgi:two-component system LytT family response regulator
MSVLETRFNFVLIDDDSVFNFLGERVLKKSGLANNITLFSTAKEALSYFAESKQNNSDDIIFLDIQLKSGLSFDLVDFIDDTTKIVYVTAFSNFAVSAIKFKAFDYLLKPVDPTELLNCVAKCFRLKNKKSKTYLNIKNNGVSTPIEQKSILFIEADGPYCKIHLKNNQIFISAQTLKSISEKLNNDFIRVHKSYIANLAHITGYTQKEVIMENGQKINVSRVGLCELQKYFTS